MKWIGVSLVSMFIHVQFMYAQTRTEVTSPMTFDAVGFSDWSPFLKIRQDGLERYVHPENLTLVDEIEESIGGLYQVIVDGAYGAMDAEGRVVADFSYDAIRIEADYDGQWKEGMAYNYRFVVTKLAGKYGVIDAQGTEIAAPRYEEITVLDSLTIAFRLGGKWGWLDARNGEVLQTPQYDRVTRSYLWHGTVSIEEQGKEGLARRDGQVMLLPQYGFLRNLNVPGRSWLLFSDGEGRVGMLDSAGTVLLEARFRSLDGVSDADLVKFKNDNGTGLWHVGEKRAVVEGYEAIEGFVAGNAMVRKNGQYGVMRATGELLLEPRYDRIDLLDASGAYVTSGMAVVAMPTTETGVPEGVENVPQGMEKMPHFMVVATGDRRGVFDWEGNVVIPAQYSGIEPFYRNGKTFFRVYQGKDYGLFDGKGGQLLPFEYQDDTYLSTNYYPQSSAYAETYIIPLTKGDRMGLYHVALGKLILPVEHEFITWNEFDQINARRAADDGGYNTTNALLDREGRIIRPYAEGVSYTAVAADRIVETRMVDDRWYNRLVDPAGKTRYENSGWKEFSSMVHAGYHNGLLKIDGKEANLFVDVEGHEKRFDGYAFVADFRDNRALVMAYASPLEADETVGSARAKERYGIIDAQGQVVLPAVYERVEKIYDEPDLLQVSRDGKWGIAAKTGQLILDTQYDHINIPSSRPDHLDVTQDGKQGVVKRDGTVVVEPRYERVTTDNGWSATADPVYLVFDGEWYRFIDGRRGLLPIRSKNRFGY